MVLAIFSDGSCRLNPQRAYFVFYQSRGDTPSGPYVYQDIRGAVETAREHLAKGDRVWLEMQRIPIHDGGVQVVIWRSPPPVRSLPRRAVK